MIGPIDTPVSGGDLAAQVEEIFSNTGVFSKAKNFEYRPEQQAMAVAVARALTDREHLLVEAGVSIGPIMSGNHAREIVAGAARAFNARFSAAALPKTVRISDTGSAVCGWFSFRKMFLESVA